MKHLLQIFFLLSFGLSTFGYSQTDASPKVTAAKPSVKKVGESTYRVGLVEFDAKSRVISIPVIVNQREGGPIEYILVSEKGKTHESILTTKASPMNLQIVLKLLKYKAGEGDIFDKLLPSEDREIKGGKSDKRGAAVDMTVSWKSGGEEKTESINKWVIDGETVENEGDLGNPMPKHPWNYTGSVVTGGRFLAELEGSIIAIYLDPASIFNTTVEGAEIDERWGANHELIPEIGTPATLKIAPIKK